MSRIYVAKIMFNNPVKYEFNWTCISDVGIESSNCMDFWVSVIKQYLEMSTVDVHILYDINDGRNCFYIRV